MDQIRRLLISCWSELGTPLSAKAIALVENGEWAELQQLSLKHPTEYESHHAYMKDALVTELFRKCRLPADDKRLKRNAAATFWAMEAQCVDTNVRLARYISETQDLRDPADGAVDDFIRRWRKEVKRVLGKVSYVLEPRFSPGATLSDSGMNVSLPDKLTSRPTCYSSSLALYRENFMFTPIFEKYPVPLVKRANKFFTVPKDSFKDRGCCMEASVNVSLQLAVGSLLKRRYKQNYRYSLESRPLRHQRLARVASAGRRALSTIDLSNASDTVSYNLVKLVLPEDWFVLLNSLRATHTLIEGKEVYLSKFSSMGNGFTFELETILFQTLCDTVIGCRRSSSFGDDMVVPTEHAPAILAALRFFGFTPNEKKTFCDGPFRESCGGDYFDGQPVRAHYLKELPSEPQHWIALMNGLRRAENGALHYYKRGWAFCKAQLPKDVRRCLGPKWLGDLVIVCDDDKVPPPVLRGYTTTVAGRKYQNSPTYFYRVYRPVAKTFELGTHFSYRVATAAASLGVKSRFSLRNGPTGFKLDWVAAYGRSDGYGWVNCD